MKIRKAVPGDIHQICELLRHYRSETPWKRLAQADNEAWVSKLLTVIVEGGGIALLAERDGEMVGMLLGLKNTNIWDPSIFVINELAFWVEPEHRGSRAGFKLIRAYIDHCENLKEHGAIEGYTISKMVNSPDLDYGRFGFEKLEEMWRA